MSLIFNGNENMNDQRAWCYEEEKEEEDQCNIYLHEESWDWTHDFGFINEELGCISSMNMKRLVHKDIYWYSEDTVVREKIQRTIVNTGISISTCMFYL